MSDAGPVYLDADEIRLGFLVRQADQRVAIAKTDFQGAWRVAAEAGIDVETGVRRQSISWPKAYQRLFLGAGNPPITPYEGVDGSRVRIGVVQADLGVAWF
jgi:TorA maturation chaperone TorD